MSHRETHFLFNVLCDVSHYHLQKMRLTVRRIKTTFFARMGSAVFDIHVLIKGWCRRRRAGPLHRVFRASPHSCGGASNDVTHCQRKYHYSLRCFSWLAALPKLLYDVVFFAPSSRFPASFHGGLSRRINAGSNILGTYLIALFSCYMVNGLFPARRSAQQTLCTPAGWNITAYSRPAAPGIEM